ncbi:MAG: hypothetical protein ACPGYP_09025 [Solirubrobacterales bacterium]
MTDPPTIEQLIEPHRKALGISYEAYRNHVVRQLALCNLLGADRFDSDTRLALTVAGAFHDIGIWTDRTWDYLHPSLALAEAWLREQGRDDLVPLVARMVLEHHGLSARGAADDPVEVFRRADVIEVWLGIRRYGVSFRNYRRLLRDHPERGFHLMLIREFFRNLVKHPLRPLPMFRR